VQTDASGIAKPTSWTLGNSAGTNTLRGTIAGVATPVTFTATGVSGTAASIVINPATSSQGQSAVVGSTVANAPSVLVRDANGNPIANLGVRFTVATGNGKLLANAGDATGSTTFDATTDASGIATAFAWKLGAVGSNTLSVSIPTVGAVTPFIITATGTVGPPATIAAVTETPSSNNQIGFVNSDLHVAPGAIVKDAQGNPVAGVSITFTVASGGGTIKTSAAGSQVTGGTVTTDANGIARLTSWTMGAAAGANTLTASVTANSGVTMTFTATAVVRQIVAKIEVNAGDSQNATVNTAVATPPSVKVTDINNAAVPGVWVVFTASGGSGQATQATVQTDVNGVAKPGSWILGRVAGAQALTATLVDDNSASVLFGGSTTGTLSASDVAGNPVVFNATANAGPAAKLFLSTESVVRNRIGFDAFVQVTDTYGNDVAASGVTVTASIGGTGATLQGVTTRTTSSGGYVVFPFLALAGTAGSRTFTVGAPSLTAATQNMQLIGGVPVKIAVNGGDSQSATQLTALTTNPSVKVTDVDNNPVENVEVRFAVTGGSGQVSDASVYTNASGIAQSFWTLGPIVGTQTMSASVIGEFSGDGVTFTGSTSGTTLTTATVAGNPVMFAATATDRAVCTASVPTLTIGTPITTTLDRNTDCLRNLSGTYLPIDPFNITTSASQTNFALTMTSSAVSPRIASLMWPPLTTSFYNEGSSPFSMYYFVKPGTYQVQASTSTVSNGSYTISSTLNPSIPTGCLYGIVTTGVTLNHSMDTGCNYTQNGGQSGSSKRYIIAVPANTALNIAMTSSAFTSMIEIYSISGTSRTFIASNAGATASISNTSSVARLIEIRATHLGGVPTTGAFTLTIP
jgi:adhesin/invasin